MLQTRRILKTILLALLINANTHHHGHAQGYAGVGGKGYRNQQQTNRQPQNQAVGIVAPPQIQSVHERRRTSEEMRKYLNTETDQCEDFYDYACGNWLKAQNVSESEENHVITLNNRLELKVIEQLQRRFEDPSRHHPVVNKFYRSCNSVSEMDQKSFIKTLVSHYGGLPDIKDTWRERNYVWSDIIARLKLDYNLDILITFTNPPNGKPILSEPQNTILPTELCNAEAASQIDEKDEIFDAIQMEIKEKLQSWFQFEEADATRLAGDIQRFEFDLCKFMRKGELLNVGNEVASDLEENSIGEGPPQGASSSKFGRNRENQRGASPDLEDNPKLINFVQLSLGQAQGTGRSDFETPSPEYLQYLTSIIGRKPSFANYIIYRALSELTIPVVGQPMEERKAFCIRKTMEIFPAYMGNLYQNTIQGPMREFIKQDVATIFRDIKEAMPRNMRKYVDSLQISEPIYPPGLDNTLSGIKINGNYWEILKSVTIISRQSPAPGTGGGPQQRGRNSASPPPSSLPNAVEAFASSMASNDKFIHYGWGLLQPPFYSYNYPKSLKYSSLGYAIARELVKRFIDEQQSLEGKAMSSYSQIEFNEFLTNRECFRSQVSGYFFNTPELFRNGTQLREIMADVSALSIAFLAYTKWLDKQDVSNTELKLETLPHMNLSNTQLFFLNYAQMRCAAEYTTEEMPSDIAQFFPLDLHSVERLNVNGPLANDMEFGLDFGCPLGVEMNYGDKCSIISNDFKSGY
ncbi:endothelin-converting enzyme homolog [Haematobia irritans]|uniref:endothelin-converting enzyme homolog n=1 Tax=Haematobia irritans TaxID=7368 RepID=UPI003F501A77